MSFTVEVTNLQQMQRTLVRAPFDGIVSDRKVSAGDTAQVGPGIAKRMGMQLLTYVSRIVELDMEARTITVERRAEGGVQVLKTSLADMVKPCLY